MTETLFASDDGARGLAAVRFAERSTDLPPPRYEVIPAAPKTSKSTAAARGKRSCCFCSTEQKSQKRRLVSGVHFARVIFSPQ